MKRKAIIIGAGPAGLTAAFELLNRTDIIPIILEKSNEIGGISRTTVYKGNRMDMGPHRFFSKSERVMDWWLRIMPLQKPDDSCTISYQNKTATVSSTSEPDDSTKAMLVIKRLTRIYFLRKFFAYPLQLTWDTLRALGFLKTIKILCSFVWAKLFPRRPERNLEDFIINRFGKQLYLLFFKDYTEKVWGKVPNEISAEWGAQRIKGVSLSKALQSALRARRTREKETGDIAQKGKETSLIEQFLYPRFGTGSLWEEVARQIREKGGQIYFAQDVRAIDMEGHRIVRVETTDRLNGETTSWEGDYFFSTMPVQELIAGMGSTVPLPVSEVAVGLQYRDFINVGLLLKGFSSRERGELQLKDNWIYVQERDVKVGRLMIYNNWGGSMVMDPDTTWIGMEYFCNKTDELWFESDEALRRLAIEELDRMDLAQPQDVLDGTVQRMEKTYPAYFGTYDRFDTIKAYTDQFENLFLVGRNGMHKYNNADHSMLCSMVAVDNIVAGNASKANIWAINTEQEYHEEKKPQQASENEIPGLLKSRVKHPFLVDYLWSNRANRAWWMVGMAVIILELIVFKIRYPFANYMPDSYSYLQAAYSNADVNLWPVGYSKFLRLLSVFTHSDKIVVSIQYLNLQVSSLFFFFTLIYFVRPGKLAQFALFLLIVVDPIPLYLSNYISADALFIALSLYWISTLIWILYSFKSWMIPVQALLILACFTIRYNAVIYPVFAILTFLLTGLNWRMKWAGIGLTFLLLAVSISYTTIKMEAATGKRQFSAFGGWQLANNALYMYSHIGRSNYKPLPARFDGLDRMVKQHFDTLAKVKLTAGDSVRGYFYLWSEKGPLIQYMVNQWKKDSTSPYIKRWGAEGPLYASYALNLIANYPLQYFKYFLWPNANKYALPPLEFLGVYNMGSDTVGRLAKEWFGYKSQKLEGNYGNHTVALLKSVPVAVALVNLFFLISTIGFLLFNGFKRVDRRYSVGFLLVILLWFANLGFSVFASPIVLRYQVFTTFICLAFAIMSFDYVFKLDNHEK